MQQHLGAGCATPGGGFVTECGGNLDLPTLKEALPVPVRHMRVHVVPPRKAPGPPSCHVRATW